MVTELVEWMMAYRKDMKLSKKDQELVMESVQKHVNIRYNDGIDGQVSDCPLCEEYNNVNTWQKGNSCWCCPVQHYTKRKFCVNTPYEKWEIHLKKSHPKLDLKIHCNECKKLVTEEIKFLAGLLPYEIEIV